MGITSRSSQGHNNVKTVKKGENSLFLFVSDVYDGGTYGF